MSIAIDLVRVSSIGSLSNGPTTTYYTKNLKVLHRASLYLIFIYTRSVLNPDAAEIDRASIDPTASPTPAFSSASLVAVTPYASEVTPTTTLTVPAVLTTGPVVSETSTATANATASVAAAALVPTTARQLGVVVVCLVVGAFLS